MLKKIAVSRMLSNRAENEWQRDNQGDAILAKMNHRAALRHRFDPVGGSVVPGELRRILRLPRIRVGEIKFVLLALQFFGERIFRCA